MDFMGGYRLRINVKITASKAEEKLVAKKCTGERNSQRQTPFVRVGDDEIHADE